eukprot:TRINITY_DN8774_c0_g3_i1.p3 TRINITY_DN8774_c0_g3~~TRINITY_DN8774_c0_g3_i1.p3  ORF type:complete len:115 (-),score=4.98 TRINITY_DN8774_c0_g3_i1:345-689(-)
MVQRLYTLRICLHSQQLLNGRINEIKGKLQDLETQISREEQQKLIISEKITQLNKELNVINDSLATKTKTREEYRKVISETEAAYNKILESQQTLLQVLKRETLNMQKKKQQNS